MSNLRSALVLALVILGSACTSEVTRQDGPRQRGVPVAVGPAARPGVDGPRGHVTPGTPAERWTGTAPIVVSTRDRMRAQAEQPPPPLDARDRPRAKKIRPDRRALPQNPDAVPHARATAPSFVDRHSTPRVAQTATAPTVDVATLADTGALPPDTMGDIGPSQYLVGLNGRLRTVAKATGLADGVLDQDTDVFFPAALRGGGLTSDPRVRYDRRTNRWYVLMITVALPNRFVLAVSSDATLAPSTTWSMFQWTNTRTQGGLGVASCLADYPTLGVDEDALYIGVNQFCGAAVNALSFDSTSVYVVNKSSLVSGTLRVAQFDEVLASATSNGIYTPQGVDNFDSNTNEGYVIGVDNRQFGALVLHRVTNPAETPSISTAATISVPETGFPINVPHQGGVLRLDGLDDRLLQAVVRGGRLWTNHQIEVNSGGQADSAGERNGIRWYEIGNLTGTPTLVQSGTVFDGASSNPLSYFMGAIMPNGQGHVALGMSVAGAAAPVNTAFTGRLASDPLGTMDPPAQYSTNTSFAYNQQSAPEPTQRWGDYSYTSVDPDDDMTLWTLQQYVSAPNQYAVRLVRLQAPAPAAIASVSPSVIDANVPTVIVTVTGAAADGSGFYDPGPGFARRIAAAVSGSGVTVTDVTVTSPTTLTLVLDTTGAAVGARTLTVTNPDGQTTTLAAAFTIGTSTPAPPSFSGVPGNRTIYDAGRGATTGPLAFLVADPQGTPVTLTFTSSNLTVVPLNRVELTQPDAQGNASIAVSSAGQFGSSTITITASDGTLSSTASFVVTVALSGVPTPPQDLRATVLQSRVTFTWLPPASAATEPVTSYRLEAGYGPGQTVAVLPAGNTTTYTVFNPPDGVFFVRLRALTSAGMSAPSNEVQFAIGQVVPPLAPLALLATVQGTNVTLRWTENPQGPPITGYQVRAGRTSGASDVGVVPLPGTARSLVAAAPPGTYYVRVVAVNAAGVGAGSNEAVVVAQPGTCTIPATPTGFLSSVLPGRLTVRWDAPTSGAIPTSYVAEVGSTSGASDRGVFSLAATTTTASGVVARGPYFVRLRAVNACGRSAPSLETSAVVP